MQEIVPVIIAVGGLQVTPFLAQVRFLPPHYKTKMRGAMNSFSAMALALWEEYEESLPDAPGNMTRKLIRILRAKGFYLTDHKLLDDNPKGAIERESNYQRGTQ